MTDATQTQQQSEVPITEDKGKPMEDHVVTTENGVDENKKESKRPTKKGTKRKADGEEDAEKPNKKHKKHNKHKDCRRREKALQKQIDKLTKAAATKDKVIQNMATVLGNRPTEGKKEPPTTSEDEEEEDSERTETDEEETNGSSDEMEDEPKKGGKKQKKAKKPKKKSAPKGPKGYPKPPRNHWNFFISDPSVKDPIRAANPDIPYVPNVTKLLAARWKGMNAEQKKPYQNQAEADVIRFQQEVQAWELAHPNEAKAFKEEMAKYEETLSPLTLKRRQAKLDNKPKETKETKETKEPKETKETKEPKEPKEPKSTSETAAAVSMPPPPILPKASTVKSNKEDDADGSGSEDDEQESEAEEEDEEAMSDDESAKKNKNKKHKGRNGKKQK